MASHKVHPLVALGIAGSSLAGGYLLGKRRLRTSIPSPPKINLTLQVGTDPVVQAEIAHGDVLLKTVEMLLSYVTTAHPTAKMLSVNDTLLVERAVLEKEFDLSNAWIRVQDPKKWQAFTPGKPMKSELTVEMKNTSKTTNHVSLTLFFISEYDPLLIGL